MVAAALKHFARHPGAALKALSDPALAWRFYDLVVDRVGAAFETKAAPGNFRLDEDWSARLHTHLGATECGEDEIFIAKMAQANALLAHKGFKLGPESYFGFNDGDPEFLKAIWCLIRHLRPERVVETGVAHGLTSRLILEAMELNQSGHLWSIDKPPLDPSIAAQVGAAVDGTTAKRWTLLKGSSRQCLPAVLREIGKIDLFIHDSLHTDQNVRFEVFQALNSLGPGGYIVIDDIDANVAFEKIVAKLNPPLSLICQSRPIRRDGRRFDGKGLFGIIGLGAN